MDKEKILYLVDKALQCQFDIYSWENMVDDIEELTEEERKFAKEDITYKAYIIPE